MRIGLIKTLDFGIYIFFMKLIKSKYPIKIGKTLIPKGTQGETVSIEEVKKTFPNIEYSLNSIQVAVKFFDLNPCICHISQIEYL